MDSAVVCRVLYTNNFRGGSIDDSGVPKASYYSVCSAMVYWWFVRVNGAANIFMGHSSTFSKLHSAAASASYH